MQQRGESRACCVLCASCSCSKGGAGKAAGDVVERTSSSASFSRDLAVALSSLSWD